MTITKIWMWKKSKRSRWRVVRTWLGPDSDLTRTWLGLESDLALSQLTRIPWRSCCIWPSFPLAPRLWTRFLSWFAVGYSCLPWPDSPSHWPFRLSHFFSRICHQLSYLMRADRKYAAFVYSDYKGGEGRTLLPSFGHFLSKSRSFQGFEF